MTDRPDLATQFMTLPGGRLNCPAPVPRAFLFEGEVIDRYCGNVSASMLEKWRGNGDGPRFSYIGRTPVYPLAELVEWEISLKTFRSTTEKSSKGIL